MNEIEQKIYDFIKETFDVSDDDSDYTPDVNLFDAGFVDSLGAFEIITFVETTFGVEITKQDLTLCPMNSVQEIAAVVSAKL